MTSNPNNHFAPALSKGARARSRSSSNRPRSFSAFAGRSSRQWTFALAAFALLPGCQASDAGNAAAAQAMARAVVTIESAGVKHVFNVDVARTKEEQARGLMFRTNVPADGGMLFAPYPAEGGGPKEASFWMKDTPTPLDIIFIRADGTIAHIAENTVPYSQDQVRSGEPVAAVLELVGGRTAELGISRGDKVGWK